MYGGELGRMDGANWGEWGEFNSPLQFVPTTRPIRVQF